METELICEECGETFFRRTTEVKRNAKMGRKVFCSRSCAATQSPSALNPPGFILTGHNAGRKKDEFSPFRRHLKRSRTRKCESSVTLEDLKYQFELQDGICPYSGWELTNEGPKHKRMSLDRIDSSKGYILGNIQWVCVMANYAKNDFTNENLLEFCEALHLS